MSRPTGISADQARSHIATLDLLLATAGIDTDTERRAQWLRLRLRELVPQARLPFDLVEARIAIACPAEGVRRAATASAA